MGLDGSERLMATLTTTAARLNAWAAAGFIGNCRSGKYADIKFFGKGVGGVPTPAVDAYRALEQVLKATGYTPKSAWAFNFRKITGGSKPCTCANFSGCSVHGTGAAIDIDPSLNPYTTKAFSWNDTKFTPAQIAAIEAIRNTKGEQIWEWGGRWKSKRDYMHFEIRVDPASLQVNWSTVKGGGGPTPTPTPGDDDMFGLNIGKVGDPVVRGPRVMALQVYLSRVGFDTKGVDGIAGDNTRRALNSWKAAMGITPALSAGEGVIGEWEYGAMLAFSQQPSGGSGVDQTARDAAFKAQAAASAAKVTADTANALANQNKARIDKLRSI
jgi:hypothetical protein